MNLVEINRLIKNLSLAYPTIQEYGDGDIYEWLNSGEHKYPTIFLTISSISNDDDVSNISCTLFYVDRLLSDNSNRLQIQTVGTTALKAILSKATDTGVINIDTVTYNPFTEKFSDVCAGVYAQLTLQFITPIDCDSYEGATLTIKEDGLYSTLGYEQVIVDVTKVRTIGGHSGDITLGKGLTISDDNVLSGTEQATFEQGENITITHKGDNYRFDVPDMRYDDSIGAFNTRQRYNEYLYGITYNSIDYESAKEHFIGLSENLGGACSMIRKGNLFGRNYDWTINNQVEFVVATRSSASLYSVFGVASVAGLTTENLNRYSKEYLYLPFRILDGINEKGLVCNVNQLPYNEQLSISANGTTPSTFERDVIPMIMLVRYILDKFDNPITAADYIKNYVKVLPIIGEDGLPMNFHFAIGDENVTVYLYFEGTQVKYEIKTKGENLVMTNFRLAGTNLVDGHYSTTDSNIEQYGQGIERANALLDYADSDLLNYLVQNLNFTRAYTTTDRLTEFAGIDGVTIDNEQGLLSIQADAALLYEQERAAGTLRTDADLWQTVHSVVYDFSDKSVRLCVQEIEGFSETFTFYPYPRVEVNITIDEIAPSITNFVPGTTYTIYNAIQRIANLFAGYWNYIKTNITDLIPSQANKDNQLADKAFVNETVAQNAANFRGNWNNWESVPTEAQDYPADYTGSYTPTVNDYLVVSDASDYYEEINVFTKEGSVNVGRYWAQTDFLPINNKLTIRFHRTYTDSAAGNVVLYNSNHESITTIQLPNTTGPGEYGTIIDLSAYNDVKYVKYSYMRDYDDNIRVLTDTEIGAYDGSWRFLYTGDWASLGKSGWTPAYRIGSAFTDAQQAAIDSTITADKVATYDSYEERIDSVETDKRDRIYEANKIYATDSEGKDYAMDLATVLEHSYNSLIDKPKINGVEVSGNKTSADFKISSCTQVNKIGPSITLFANELAIVESDADVTVTLDNSRDLQGSVNEYRLQLTATAPIQISFTAPDLKWSYDVPNYLVNGKTYEISIINKHATYLVF